MTQPEVPVFWVSGPVVVERVNDVTLLLSSDVTYTSVSSGLTATAFAPASCASRSCSRRAAPLTMQPVPSVAWVSAPVDGSRAKMPTALPSRGGDVDVVAVGADRHALRRRRGRAPGAQP